MSTSPFTIPRSWRQGAQTLQEHPHEKKADTLAQAWWFSLLFYVLTLSLTKVSICLLYLTIFTIEWARRACYALLLVVGITSLWSTATVFTYCVPLQATWDFTVVATFCQSQDAWWANTRSVHPASSLPHPAAPNLIPA